ncbi:MAG: xanthine dehydrogenase molybdopterin binding subunit [Opitutaceae bacterium]|nr:xanthine dehydrogenase molybdopterin binding subunit [Opitutaceae bacterium]
MAFDFILNGKAMRIDGLAPTTTLLDYLRTHGCTGSKQGCAEGDCGACTVAIVDHDAHGQPTYRAINSCIALLPMFAGREVITVDGLADGAKLHPAQSTMVEHYGSQCGYCTPGFVVSMFEAYNRSDCQASAKISDQLCGNLCRCTGYRPIRDAALATMAQRGADKFKVRLTQPLAALGELDYAAGGERFFRPTSLAALFALKAAHPAAQLVAGATEIGVELNKKAKAFPLLISVEAVSELTQILKTPSAWRIGAGATLTNVEEALGAEFPSLQKMLSVYASRQIRSRATIGGNIATASPIGDSAPLLLTLDAVLVLTAASGERTVALQDFFIGYRQTVLRADEVIQEIVVPRVSPMAGHTRRVDYFKVSKRRDMDISIVAGAFRVETDAAGVVRFARLAFGGVAATPVRALLSEAALLGKTLPAAAEAVAAVLRTEFTPIDDVRGGADYRRGLIVSLWEKFVSGEHSLAQDGVLDFAVGAPVPPTDASHALRHDSAVGHVTGRALYVDDTAQRRPMLEVWPVMALHARAKITRRDATKARACAGIAAVLLAEDIPGENNVGPVLPDEPMLATDQIQFHGQIVAIVVGDSIRACRAAAAMVEVDYVPLPPLLGVRAAISAGSFHSRPHELVRGDVVAALAASPHTLEGEFEFGGQEHFYLETQAAWAEAGEDGAMMVHSSTQHPSEIQNIVAEVLHVARHKVVVQSPRMGGGFGGKETQGNAPAAIVALAALKTGRPVHWQLDRDVDMMITGKRHPFWAKFKVGYDSEGRLLASQVELVSDGGWSMDLSQAICDRALFHLDNAYFIPAVRFTGRIAKTNVTSHTAFRGFGGPQGMLVVEEIVSRIAGRLRLAPEIVRARNFYHGAGETNTTHYRQDLGINRIQEVWNRVLTEASFAERRRAIAVWNAQSGRVKRGLAVTPVKFGISFTLTHYNQAGALVLIYPDGSVQVNHGGTEMGQGLNTKMLGVAMRELGVSAKKIRLMPTSTDKVPNTSPTAASSGADLNGAAVRNACEILRERLRPLAAQLLGADEAESRELDFSGDAVTVLGQSTRCVSFAVVCQRAYLERVSLSTTGFYKTPGIHWDWAEAAGRPFHYFSYGASVSEVEVDGYTGMHRVRRVDIVHDVGDSLNPGIDRGQIEGGFVQGMGWLTREELKWDASGRLLTHSASTYQIPAFSDAPVEMNVTLLPMAAQPNTIHGSKAVGEPPLMLAFSVREAIRDAVANFGAPGGEVLLASPATGEAIFAAVQERLKLT